MHNKYTRAGFGNSFCRGQENLDRLIKMYRESNEFKGMLDYEQEVEIDITDITEAEYKKAWLEDFTQKSEQSLLDFISKEMDKWESNEKYESKLKKEYGNNLLNYRIIWLDDKKYFYLIQVKNGENYFYEVVVFYNKDNYKVIYKNSYIKDDFEKTHSIIKATFNLGRLSNSNILF